MVRLRWAALTACMLFAEAVAWALPASSTEKNLSSIDIGRERRIGPVLAISVPHPVNLGVTWRMSEILNFTAQGGWLLIPIKKGDITITNVEMTARWHFLSGSFFTALAAGYNAIAFSTSIKFDGMGDGGSGVTLGIKSFYVTPQLGFMWFKKSGFYIGFSGGIQIPLLWAGDLVVTGPPPTDNLAAKKASLEKSAKAPLGYYAGLKKPFVSLLTIGWLF